MVLAVNGRFLPSSSRSGGPSVVAKRFQPDNARYEVGHLSGRGESAPIELGSVRGISTR
jgi:hypothetical protein